jgi:hypothetical protein
VIDVVQVEHSVQADSCIAHRSSTPGSCVDVAVRLTPLDGFEPAGRHQEQVADDLLDPGFVLGGCCGTDHRHIERICNGCKEAA